MAKRDAGYGWWLWEGEVDYGPLPNQRNTTPTKTKTDILNDLGPIALDLIVKWAKADRAVALSQNQEQMDAAFVEKRTVQSSMRALANQIEAQRLAEAME